MPEEIKWTKAEQDVVVMDPGTCEECGRTMTVPSDRIWGVVAYMMWLGIDSRGEERIFRLQRILGAEFNLFEATALKNEVVGKPMQQTPPDDAVEMIQGVP